MFNCMCKKNSAYKHLCMISKSLKNPLMPDIKIMFILYIAQIAMNNLSKNPIKI